MSRVKRVFLGVIAILLTGCTGYGMWRLVLLVVRAFGAIQPAISAALIAGAATVIGATAAVLVGRYFERKKELEALYREKKMPIYTAFLKEIFSLFQNSPKNEGDKADLVGVLKEWQLQIVLWGGSDVVNAYLDWSAELRKGATARSVFATERLIFAIRAELGNSNAGIKTGMFPRMILRHPGVFLDMAKANPDILLNAVAQEEARLGLESE